MPSPLRALLTLIACVLITGGLAAPSHAYELGGTPWPTRTITYHSATPQYDAAITSAVAAWNASGARVRFKAVSKGRAKLQIVYRHKRGGPAGDAVLGFVKPAVVTRRTVAGIEIQGGEGIPCGTRIPGPDGRLTPVRCKRERVSPRVRLDKVSAANRRSARGRLTMAMTVSHELGHVLGLQHETRRCSIMHPTLSPKCAKPAERWQMRCRLLESDDVRGAIRRYGGRPRPLGTEFCDVDLAPTAPLRPTAAYDVQRGSIVLTWRNIALPTLLAVSVAIGRDQCPSAPDDEDQREARPDTDGRAVLRVPGAGRYCVSVWSRDWYQRLSEPASVWVEVPVS